MQERKSRYGTKERRKSLRWKFGKEIASLPQSAAWEFEIVISRVTITDVGGVIGVQTGISGYPALGPKG